MADDDHQDIHDALGILPTGPDAPTPPWTFPESPTMRYLRLQQNFNQRFPKDYFDTEKAKGTPWSPGIWHPSTPSETGQSGGLGLTQLAPPSPVATEMARSRGNVLSAAGELTGVNDLVRAVKSGKPENMLYAAGMLGLGAAMPEERAGALTESAIEKALAKNPGASIMDIAGAGPSSSWQQKYNASLEAQKANKLMPSDFPAQVPFGVPERAKGLGFTTPAVHGTPDRWGWEGPLDQLKLPDEELGVHFGDPGQAAHFSVPGGDYMKNEDSSATPRSYPAVLQVQNPLETSDMGSWGTDNMLEALSKINKGEHQDWAGPDKGRVVSPQHKGLFPTSELDQLKDIGDVRDYLTSKGFDSIKYTNSVEGVGRPSYIMFQESPTQKGYVMGVRSPFAQFDPSKLHAASVAAGVGGIAAVPLLSRNEGVQE